MTNRQNHFRRKSLLQDVKKKNPICFDRCSNRQFSTLNITLPISGRTNTELRQHAEVFKLFKHTGHLLQNCTEMDAQCCVIFAAAEYLLMFHVLGYQFINSRSLLCNLHMLKHCLKEGKKKKYACISNWNINLAQLFT